MIMCVIDYDGELIYSRYANDLQWTKDKEVMIQGGQGFPTIKYDYNKHTLKRANLTFEGPEIQVTIYQ
jgi:hypothetical protein